MSRLQPSALATDDEEDADEDGKVDIVDLDAEIFEERDRKIAAIDAEYRTAVSRHKAVFDAAAVEAESKTAIERDIMLDEAKYDFEQSRQLSRKKKELQLRQLDELIELRRKTITNNLSRSLHVREMQLDQSIRAEQRLAANPSDSHVKVTESDLVKRQTTFTRIFSKYFSHTQRRVLDSYLSQGKLAEG